MTYDVTITDVTKIISSGETVVVNYTVENTGSTQETQTIELTTSVETGTVDQDLDVTLNAGESFSGDLTYDTASTSFVEDETFTVSSNDTSDTVTVYLAEYAFKEHVDELDDGTVYEYQAVGQGDSGIDTGLTETVETVKRTLGTVTTVESAAADINQTELNVEGSVDTVGDYAEVGFDVFFQYRSQGDTQWTDTSRSTRNSAGQVTETITSLTEETTYEYRFVADFGEIGRAHV